MEHLEHGIDELEKRASELQDSLYSIFDMLCEAYEIELAEAAKDGRSL